MSQLLVRINVLSRPLPVRALLLGCVLALLVPFNARAQVIPPIVLEYEYEEDDSSRYEDIIRDLVDRYEDLRERLRVEIRRNEDMFTRAEMDEALRLFRADLQEARARITVLEARLKESEVRRRTAEEKSRRYKATLLKTEDGLLRELETTWSIVDAMQVEHLFQGGPTFSPSGRLGALGIINIPGTRLSLVAGTDYDLRDQDWTTTFGVTFRFLSQRTIVENWIRLRNREHQKEYLTPDELQAIRARRRFAPTVPLP
ncbi:MAG: hypothetical protein EA427_04125 [Spirochaetaceae bacterium]|nr:MAG: hypothetical protein EA427_04125 [Spirochaetaceae bacterium]